MFGSPVNSDSAASASPDRLLLAFPLGVKPGYRLKREMSDVAALLHQLRERGEQLDSLGVQHCEVSLRGINGVLSGIVLCGALGATPWWRLFGNT